MATTGRTRAYRLLAAAITVTADAVASIQIPQNGVITGWAWSGHTAADDGIVLVELASTSVSTIGQNDTPGTSYDVVELTQLVSGAGGAANGFVAGVQIPVTAGDKLYLHAFAGSGANAAARFTVYITH